MVAMAKRGRKPKHAETSETTGRSGAQLTCRINPELRAALDRFIAGQKYKTTLTDVVEVALADLLKAEGYWPPESAE